jgi:hypothetical protein
MQSLQDVPYYRDNQKYLKDNPTSIKGFPVLPCSELQFIVSNYVFQQLYSSTEMQNFEATFDKRLILMVFTLLIFVGKM